MWRRKSHASFLWWMILAVVLAATLQRTTSSVVSALTSSPSRSGVPKKEPSSQPPRGKLYIVESLPVVEVEYCVKAAAALSNNTKFSIPFGHRWRARRRQVQEDCRKLQEQLHSLLRHKEGEKAYDATTMISSGYQCKFTPRKKSHRGTQQTVHCKISATALGEDGLETLVANQKRLTNDAQSQVQDFFESIGNDTIQSQVEVLVAPQAIVPKPKRLPAFSYKYTCELLLENNGKDIPTSLPAWATKEAEHKSLREQDDKIIHTMTGFLHSGIFEDLQQKGWKVLSGGWSHDFVDKRGRKTEKPTAKLSAEVDFSFSVEKPNAIVGETPQGRSEAENASKAAGDALLGMAQTHDWLLKVEILKTPRLRRWKLWGRSRSARFGESGNIAGQSPQLKYRLTFHDNPREFFCPLVESPRNLKQQQIYTVLENANRYLERRVKERIKEEMNWLGRAGGSSSVMVDNENDYWALQTKRKHRSRMELDPKFDLPESQEEFESTVEKILSEEADKYDFCELSFPSK